MSSAAGTARAKQPKALPAPLTTEAIAQLEALKPTDRFAAVGGWSPMPNVLLDIPDKISGHVQAYLIEHIIRWTFGHERGAHQEALVKFLPLAKKAGYTAKAFELALNEAADRRLIQRRKEGRHWLCKVVPEDWKSVAPYDRGGNPSPVNHGRDEAGRFILGKVPVPMSELFAGVPVEAAAASFVSDVQTARPVDVALAVASDGVVSVIVRDAAPVVPEGSVLHQENVNTGTRFATVRPLFAQFRSVIDAIFLNLFRKVPDEALLAEIVTLCNGAPPEMLAVRIDEKLAAGAFKSSGLVIDLARDVGEAWRAEAARRTEESASIARARAIAEAARCPACQGHGYDPTFYRGCLTGADMTARGDAPICPDCLGTGRRPSAE